jgi:hypothetical protein
MYSLLRIGETIKLNRNPPSSSIAVSPYRGLAEVLRFLVSLELASCR